MTHAGRWSRLADLPVERKIEPAVAGKPFVRVRGSVVGSTACSAGRPEAAATASPAQSMLLPAGRTGRVKRFRRIPA
jgi:hypothetical protein